MLAPTSARRWRRIATTAKRLLVISAGFTLCGAGMVMLVLPGPGILVIFLGLLVLATEYAWAERALERTRTRALDATTRLHNTRTFHRPTTRPINLRRAGHGSCKQQPDTPST